LSENKKCVFCGKEAEWDNFGGVCNQCFFKIEFEAAMKEHDTKVSTDAIEKYKRTNDMVSKETFEKMKAKAYQKGLRQGRADLLVKAEQIASNMCKKYQGMTSTNDCQIKARAYGIIDTCYEFVKKLKEQNED